MKYLVISTIILLAFFSALFISRSLLQRRAHNKNRQKIYGNLSNRENALFSALDCDGLARKILEYSLNLEARLAHKSTQCLSGYLPLSDVQSDTSADVYNLKNISRAKKQELNILHAGLKDKIGAKTLREARLRLGVGVGFVGVVIGACLSNELMFILGAAGAIAGVLGPRWALMQEVSARSNRLKIELPELLEVVSLGMSSGLSFDRSFGLYCSYFDTSFSRACASAHKRWTMGFSTREEALGDLSSQYESNMLKHVVQNIVRSMKFGTPLSDDLKRAAKDSRAEQKAATQEQVAKVPVRMMIPTACLILPAMLILVLGPVLLELIEGF